jgi:CBS-domain-containing membrane protein
LTLIQMHPRSVTANPVHATVVDTTAEAGPQVWNDMSVEVALSVMASARAGYLLVCDEDGQCTGLVTRTQLTAVRDSSTYTDRVRLRDLAGPGEPFTAPLITMAEAGRAKRHHSLAALPVLDEHGSGLGVLALAR